MPSPRGRFALLCASTFFHFLAMGIFLAGLPLFVSRELGGSKAVVGLAVGCFSVTAVLSRPRVGRAVDELGRAGFLRGAPVLVLVTSIGLLFAHTLWAVIVLRLLQGLAGAAYYTTAATVTTDLAPGERRADYISRLSLFLFAGFAIGPALAEVLIDRGGYEWAWGTAAAASVVAAAVAFLVPETRPAREVASGPRARRLVHPAALGPGAVLLTVAVGYTAITSFSPLYARAIGMGSSGALYVTLAGTILVVRLLAGRLADRVGRVATALPGLVAGAAGMFLLASVQRPIGAFAGVGLFALSHALAFPALMALTVDRVVDAERGEALGSFTAFFDAGAAVGGYAVGFVADQAGYAAAWATPGVLCIAGLVGLLAIGRRVRAEAAALAGELPPLEPAGT